MNRSVTDNAFSEAIGFFEEKHLLAYRADFLCPAVDLKKMWTA